MRSVRSLSCCAACLVSTASAASIEISFDEPGPQSVLSGSQTVGARVQSTFQLASVTATLESVSVPLSYDGTRWTGVLALTTLPDGPGQLVVQATDIQGNSASAPVPVVVDQHPPQVSLVPQEAVLAQPGVHVHAACTPTVPGPCTLSVSVVAQPESDAPVELGTWTSTSPLDMELCLSAAEAPGGGCSGPEIAVEVQATDSLGGQTLARRLIVEGNTSPFVRAIESVPGQLLDADSNRLLYRDGQLTASIQQRDGGIPTIALGSQADSCPVCPVLQCFPYADGRLTGPGAAILSGGYVFDARPGMQTMLGQPTPVFQGGALVAGDYAPAAQSNALYRLSTQTTAVVSPPCSTAIQVAGSDIFCLDSTGSLLELPDGGATFVVLLDGGITDFAVDEPYLAYHTTAGDFFVAGPGGTSSLGGDPFSSYAISGQWLAFERPAGAIGLNQVWIRAPDGGTSQVTFFGAGTSLEALSPDGQTVVLSMGHRFAFDVAGNFSDVGPAVGRALWMNGWFLVQGNTLLEVTSTDGGFYTPKPCSSLCTGAACADGGSPGGPPKTSGGCRCDTGGAFALLALLVWSTLWRRRCK